MKNFLKICFKINIFISAILMIYGFIAFFAALFDISSMLNIIYLISDFATFGIVNEFSISIIQVLGFGLFAFIDNQYFYKVHKTLYNFDKFREITGIKVVPIFGIFQFGINAYFFGIFALIPFSLNLISTASLYLYQKSNKKKLISEYSPNFSFQDPIMHEMSLKIGQLRTLKSEGKISEEEFIFHLNNILENKE